LESLYSLNRFFRTYRWHFTGGVLFVTISNLFGIFPAQLTRNALDVVAANIDTYRLFNGFSASDEFYRLITFNIFLFGVLVLLMALLKGVFMFLMRQTIIVMSRHIEYDMKNEIYDHYQKMGMDFYNVRSTGDLMNRISEDVGRVRMYVGPAIMYTINLVVMFILVIWAMFSVNTRLALFALLPLPLMAFLVYFVQDHINRRSEAVQASLSDLSTFVQETFSGIRILKAYAAESRFEADYARQSESYRRLSMELIRVNAFFMPTMMLLVGLSTLLTIYIGSLEVINGRLSVGNIAEFVLYVNMLTWPVASLGWVITIVQRAAASQQRLDEFMSIQPTVKDGDEHTDKLSGSIVFDKVSVRYGPDRDWALREVSFSLEPGGSLGIIGHTGSGKTSIVNALMRLVDPDEGRILIDGIPLTHYRIGSFRKRIGCVPQDVFLFSDSIRANIAFRSERAGIQEIEEAAKQAVVYDNIMEFPDKFETLVGERGITLSGGQKQRISIARALIRQPDILVLDDCLSAVDTLTEERIVNNFRQVMKHTTSIIISHRVSTVRNCKQILVLEGGRVVQQGSHDSLMQNDGPYRQLFEMQLMEEKSVEG
jgi:ATP-binding cassette subfamily B protein